MTVDWWRGGERERERVVVPRGVKVSAGHGSMPATFDPIYDI